MRLLIDSSGETRTSGDLGDLRIRLSGPALSQYLIVNLGWVEAYSDGIHFKVRARPRVLSQHTLAGLFYALGDAAPKYISAETYDKSWEQRRFVSTQGFRTFFTSLTECPRETDWLGDSRLLRRRIPANRSPFASIVDRAQMIAANVRDPNGIVTLLSRSKMARWSVCRVDAEERQSIVLAKTNNYTPFNIDFSNTTRSTPMGQYADSNYSRWVTNAHCDALEAMSPRFEHVDAITQFPTLGEVRLRYDTVTLPVRLTDGSQLLVCGSMDNAGIDLRQSIDQKAC